jgi:regulator of chromosome condensation
VEVKLDYAIDLISAGDNHSIFASSGAGKVYFTGNYKYMRGEKMAEPTKTPIVEDIDRISGRGNPVSKLTKVASGSNHSVILLDGRVYTRGEPEAHTVGRRISARQAHNQTRNSLTFEGVGIENAVDLWCGGYHTMVKVKKGRGWAYWTWGLTKHGQLGMNTYDECPLPKEVTKLRNKDIVDVAAGTNFTVLLTEEGDLFGCGQNDEGQLALGENYQFLDSDEE